MDNIISNSVNELGALTTWSATIKQNRLMAAGLMETKMIFVAGADASKKNSILLSLAVKLVHASPNLEAISWLLVTVSRQLEFPIPIFFSSRRRTVVRVFFGLLKLFRRGVERDRIFRAYVCFLLFSVDKLSR